MFPDMSKPYSKNKAGRTKTTSKLVKKNLINLLFKNIYENETTKKKKLEKNVNDTTLNMLILGNTH